MGSSDNNSDGGKLYLPLTINLVHGDSEELSGLDKLSHVITVTPRTTDGTTLPTATDNSSSSRSDSNSQQDSAVTSSDSNATAPTSDRSESIGQRSIFS